MEVRFSEEVTGSTEGVVVQEGVEEPAGISIRPGKDTDATSKTGIDEGGPPDGYTGQCRMGTGSVDGLTVVAAGTVGELGGETDSLKAWYTVPDK